MLSSSAKPAQGSDPNQTPPLNTLKLQKSKSSANSEAWEIANNENKNDETGIAARTRSKCEIDMPEIKLKSSLKKKTLED